MEGEPAEATWAGWALGMRTRAYWGMLEGF